MDRPVWKKVPRISCWISGGPPWSSRSRARMVAGILISTSAASRSCHSTPTACARSRSGPSIPASWAMGRNQAATSSASQGCARQSRPRARQCSASLSNSAWVSAGARARRRRRKGASQRCSFASDSPAMVPSSPGSASSSVWPQRPRAIRGGARRPRARSSSQRVRASGVAMSANGLCWGGASVKSCSDAVGAASAATGRPRNAASEFAAARHRGRTLTLGRKLGQSVIGFDVRRLDHQV